MKKNTQHTQTSGKQRNQSQEVNLHPQVLTLNIRKPTNKQLNSTTQDFGKTRTNQIPKQQVGRNNEKQGRT